MAFRISMELQKLLRISTEFFSTVAMLFRGDQVTRTLSVEFWVVLTTVLLVVRFLLDFFGPWYAYRKMTGFILTLEMLNYAMVHYTIGLMQLSAPEVNDYFQVWAVLLVTLQYSVKIGRPYSRSKQIPLLDLMSSFWTAHLIRMQTFIRLRVSLWLIWAVNAARIISYFSSSAKAEAINQESTRLVADYMSYEHELGDSQLSAADVNDPSSSRPFTMDQYRYIVHGEAQVLKDLQDGLFPDGQVQGGNHGIRLDPQVYHKLVTVDKIYASNNGFMGCCGTADQAIQLKDVCLSFSLYKLLRHRFHNLPLHETRLAAQVNKIRRLVFNYILHDAETAFRIMATELSFLQDLFYSKHASLFAGGFPIISLLLSVSLIAATGYIAYPVHNIPRRMDPRDVNRISHGVFITRVIVALVIGKELAEIYMYVFSQWTKVLMLCNYAAKGGCMSHWLLEAAMRVLFWCTTRGGWNEKIRQHNLLISSVAVKFPSGYTTTISMCPTGMKMAACTKQAIFGSVKKLEGNQERLGSYFSIAFSRPGQPVHERFKWAVHDLEADTHRILVWHIATCLCEIELASDKAAGLRPFSMAPRPYVKKPKPVAGSSTNNGSQESVWWDHYTTAASFSNYCAYLVTQALVPDNGLVARKVFNEVRREIISITIDGGIRNFLRRRSMKDVFARLMATVRTPGEAEEAPDHHGSDEEAQAPVEPGDAGALNTEGRQNGDPLDIDNSLTKKGVRLANDLMDEFKDNRAHLLWEKLADFWTEFLLHLAASTKASKHKMSLARSRELTTHLWALLAHAGYLETRENDQELLDPVELLSVIPQN